MDDNAKKPKKKGMIIAIVVIALYFGSAAAFGLVAKNNKGKAKTEKETAEIIVEEETKEDIAEESKETDIQDEENKNTVNLTSYEHKASVEEFVMSFVPNADFSFKNYHEWDDGAGFIVVENTYEEKGMEHSYVVRLGKDNVVYKLAIDDQVIFKADTDALIEYMEKYPEE